METSRLRANMKQKCAKTMHVPTKTVWLSWREIVLIFPCLHPLFLNLIYKLPCIFKQKVFWNEKKTNWRKMSKKTSKSFRSRHSFPDGCDIFQQEKAWSWHFPRSFNCDALGFLWRERKQFFFPNLDCLSHFYSGIPFDMGACSNIQSTANTWCHKKDLPILTGWEQPCFQEDLIPVRLWSTKNSTRQHLLKSCLPFNPARMGLALLSEVLKSPAAFKPSKQRKSTLCLVWFGCLAA